MPADQRTVRNQGDDAFSSGSGHLIRSSPKEHDDQTKTAEQERDVLIIHPGRTFSCAESEVSCARSYRTLRDGSFEDAFPGTSCQATIGASLRDGLADGSQMDLA